MPDANPYISNVYPIRGGKLTEDAALGPTLKGGGGGDTFDPMEPRVKALENAFLRMDSKLDTITNDLAYIKGKLEGMPTALAFGELKGRVDSLPTTTKLGALLAVAVGAFTLITRWAEVKAVLGL